MPSYATAPAAYRSISSPSETDIQRALVKWCRVHGDERQFVMHLANEGKRSKAGHGIMIGMGMIPGASDLLIPAARMGWNGLFLELKAKGKRPTDKQTQFGTDMQACGYCYMWVDNLDDAIMVTTRYMAGHIARPNWIQSNWIPCSQPAKVSA